MKIGCCILLFNVGLTLKRRISYNSWPPYHFVSLRGPSYEYVYLLINDMFFFRETQEILLEYCTRPFFFFYVRPIHFSSVYVSILCLCSSMFVGSLDRLLSYTGTGLPHELQSMLTFLHTSYYAAHFSSSANGNTPLCIVQSTFYIHTRQQN